jgi:aldose 1-epimerase
MTSLCASPWVLETRDKYALGKYEILEWKHIESDSSIQLCPQMGASILQLRLQGQDLLRSDVTEEDFLTNPYYRGRFLFPFNDRIPDGQYLYGGHRHQLICNDLDADGAIHGLVHDQPFEVIDSILDDDDAKISLYHIIHKEQHQGYPFSISLKIDVHLAPDHCILKFEVENHDDGPAPFSLGWHPYFSMQGCSIDDCHLQCDALAYVDIDENLMPTGALLPTKGGAYDYDTPKSLKNVQLDMALMRKITPSKTISSASLFHKQRSIHITTKGALFPFTQLFIPPERDSIAIEPITSPTNAFNRHHLGLMTLAPHEKMKGQVSITTE